MAEDQVKTQPIDWNIFLQLLATMDGMIHRMPAGDKKQKWIRYQTLIICGGFFGLRAKEFLNLSWDQVVNKKESSVFQFKTKRKRKIYFNEKVIKMLDHNYFLINPLNIHHLILHKQSSPTEPISTRQFNDSFAKILATCEIETENPSSHTLRKTFARHIWVDLYNKTEEGIVVTSEMLDHQDIEETKTYLGIKTQQIRDTYLRF